MKELIFITGEKGTGKTTFAKSISNCAKYFSSINEMVGWCFGYICFNDKYPEQIIIDGFDKKDYSKLKEFITKQSIKHLRLILISNTCNLNDIDIKKMHFDFYKEIKCTKL